jgi:hypothetical protein
MIKREDFNKLSQLDRIEYRQRRDVIEKDAMDFGAVEFLTKMVYLMFILIIVALQFYSINIDSYSKVMMTMPLLTKITVIVFTLLMIGSLVQHSITRKKLKQLNEEYFTEVIDVRKKK